MAGHSSGSTAGKLCYTFIYQGRRQLFRSGGGLASMGRRKQSADGQAQLDDGGETVNNSCAQSAQKNCKCFLNILSNLRFLAR